MALRASESRRARRKTTDKAGLCGDKNPQAKLNWQKVREIRASTDTKPVLAARYGVSESTIDFILRRYTWIE